MALLQTTAAEKTLGEYDMKHSKISVIRLVLTGILILFLCACAKPYHLNVNYSLPEAPDPLQGQKIRLEVEDQRENKDIFSKTAKKEFDLWDGTFALVLNEEAPAEQPQTYDLTTLLYEAMKTRLEAMQIEVVDASDSDTPLLTIALEKLLIDLKGRTWHSHIVYKAQLSRDSSKIGKETVSGKAERTKVMGKGGGQKLTGEMFSESINKLDIRNLFKNAGLI